MKEVFKRLVACNDITTIKNCVLIIAENDEARPDDAITLETMMQIQSELDSCCFDEEMAKIHLQLIGQLYTMDVAKDYWIEANTDKITIWDWCVLWGEMTKQHSEKIKKWFPSIQDIDFERKIFDECVNFLTVGKRPFHDLKL